MCWRDDTVTTRWCSLCNQKYYGDLGHRNCPANFNFFYLHQGELSNSQINNINELLKQLTDRPREVSQEILNKILGQSGVFILAVKNQDDKIIAMATLGVRGLLLNKTAIIGDVVVDEKYRGMKLGKKMMELLIKTAKSEEASFLSLTSHPRRIEANKLYQSLGFKLVGNIGESNYYRLSL